MFLLIINLDARRIVISDNERINLFVNKMISNVKNNKYGIIYFISLNNLKFK